MPCHHAGFQALSRALVPLGMALPNKLMFRCSMQQALMINLVVRRWCPVITRDFRPCHVRSCRSAWLCPTSSCFAALCSRPL